MVWWRSVWKTTIVVVCHKSFAVIRWRSSILVEKTFGFLLKINHNQKIYFASRLKRIFIILTLEMYRSNTVFREDNFTYSFYKGLRPQSKQADICYIDSVWFDYEIMHFWQIDTWAIFQEKSLFPQKNF